MKRITALLICALMVFCLLPATAMAADTWDGTAVDTSWYNTTDTEFTIYTAAELAGLAQIVNDGGALIDDPVIDDDYHYNFRGVTITLGGDIDLGGHEWTPIGYFDPTGIGGWQLFAGTFDGGGHTISGLAIGTASSPETSLYMAGLFAETYTGSCLENLNVESTGIYSLYSEGSEYGAYVGILAASADGRVTNCTATGDVTGGDGAHVGGLAGSSGGDMTNCHVSGNVVGGNGSDAGGLVGDKGGGALTGCYATGNVTGGGSSYNTYTGGLVGNGYMGTISNCFATGNVTGNGDYTGGFIGFFDWNTSISGCYAAGNVTGNGYYAGGFAGYCYGSTLDSCFATGNVQLTDGGCVGGFIGSNGGYATGSAITRCYALGNVTNTGNNVEVGGFAGFNNHEIEDCYAAGSVSGGSHDYCLIGGFIGNNHKDIQSSYARGAVSGGGTDTYIGGFAGGNFTGATLGNCYFDTRDAGLTAGTGLEENSQTVTGLAPDEMTGSAASGNMTGLDFTTAWTAKATDSKWYFPQLTAFAGSSDNAVKALSLGSVTLTPFTVTFNSNSGSTVASEYGYYTAVSKPADPTKANSVFQGWYDNPGFSGSPWDFSTIISADRTLYAKWADLSHTVTFQSNFTLKTPSLTVKATDHRTVELSWKAVRGADGYYVFKKIGSAYQKIATVKGATIYADTGLSANVKYYYKVQAFRVPYLDEVTSKASSAKYARPVWPDVRITNIRAADYDSITLAWKGTAEAAGYQVLRSTSKKSGYTAIGTCAANTYTDDTAQAGVTYYYEVKAYDAYGAYSTASAYKSARTVPGTPQTLSLSSSAPGSVTVAWDSAGGSTGYGVYRATSPYGKYELVKAVTGTSYTDTGLAAGKTYYYKVRAYAQPAKAKVYGQYSEIKGLTI